MAHAIRAFGWAIILCGTATLTGCVGTRASGPLPNARPADFALGLTVLGPEAGIRRPGQRPARYIVSPDATLRAAVGGGAAESVHPPIARTLTEADRDQLWSLVRQAGVATAEPPLSLNTAQGYTAPAGQRVYLIELRAADGRWTMAMPEGETGTEQAAALADTLAGWSWVTP